jgi:RNA polymerase sigma factor (sigma-70 family)
MKSETLRDIALTYSECLIEKSKKGDNKAFGKLVGLWFKRIYNFSLKYFNDHDQAMEATQRTFISVYKSIGKLKDNNSFKTWLYRIALNQCHEEERRTRRRPWYSILQSEDVLIKVEPHLDPGKQYDINEREEILMDMIQMLPEEQRIIIIMKEYEGLKFREIAESLQISENTAKSRLYYGLKGLRKSFEEHHLNLESIHYGNE